MDNKSELDDSRHHALQLGRELRVRSRREIERKVPALARAASTSTTPSSSSVTSSSREPTHFSSARRPATYSSSRSNRNIIQVMIF